MQGERTPQGKRTTAATGITIRHQNTCGTSENDGRCSCKPRYQAQVWSVRDRKVIRKTFPTLTAAKTWRQDASVSLRKRTMQAPAAHRSRARRRGFIKA